MAGEQPKSFFSEGIERVTSRKPFDCNTAWELKRNVSLNVIFYYREKIKSVFARTHFGLSKVSKDRHVSFIILE